MTKQYLVLDAEYRIDHDAHARYQAVERYDPADDAIRSPRDEKVTPRWCFKRMVAASWLLLAPADDHVLAPVRLTTIGLPEADERAVLSGLFESVSAIDGDFDIVTWGGASSDLPQMLVGAMAEGMTLPNALRPLAEPFNNRHRRHVDLMLAVGGGAARVHMAEVAAALGIPAKPVGSPGAIAGFVAQGKWSMVKSTAEADVFTTALILARYLSLTTPGGAFGVADRIASLAAAQVHRPYAAEFAAYRDRLRAAAFIEASQAHTRLAA